VTRDNKNIIIIRRRRRRRRRRKRRRRRQYYIACVAKGWRTLPETTVFMVATQDQVISTINYKKYFL
jgi:hypothetical protein